MMVGYAQNMDLNDHQSGITPALRDIVTPSPPHHRPSSPAIAIIIAPSPPHHRPSSPAIAIIIAPSSPHHRHIAAHARPIIAHHCPSSPTTAPIIANSSPNHGIFNVGEASGNKIGPFNQSSTARRRPYITAIGQISSHVRATASGELPRTPRYPPPACLAHIAPHTAASLPQQRKMPRKPTGHPLRGYRETPQDQTSKVF